MRTGQGRDAWRVVVVGVCLLFLVPAPVAAYIDPISGSIILQVLAAGFLAGVLTMKRGWARAIELTRGSAAKIRGRG